MQGEHSVDTGIIVAPHLYDIITDIADKFGVTYTTGLEEGETYGDDLSMAGVRKLSEQEDEALETLEQEKIEAYTAAAGLMSKPVDVTEEEEEE